MNAKETLYINGGTDPDGCSGCAAGRAFRAFLSAFASSFKCSGTAGMYK